MTSRLNLEGNQQSPFSPSVVNDLEIIIRTSFAPEYVLNGQLIPTAISSEDLARRGFSVDRNSYVDTNVIKTRVSDQKNKSPQTREISYSSQVEVYAIRSLFLKDSQRAVVILDDGIEGNDAHAIILDAYSRSKSGLREIKALLLPILQRTLSENHF